MRPALRDVIDQIPEPGGVFDSENFVVESIPGHERHFVGWDHRGAPCVLLTSVDGGFRAPLQLSGLEVRYSVPCRITLQNGTSRDETLSVVICTAPEVQLQDYFLHLMETILRIVGERPTMAVIVGAIGNLVDILQQLARPPRREVIGLYGELVVIALSANPLDCVAAWRADADDRFDFSIGDARLEAKATSGKLRSHMFSLEQCRPPVGTHGAVASMFVELSGGGQSIEEIVAEIVHRVEDEGARLKVQRTVAQSLGSGLTQALTVRFDDVLARSSYQLFDLRSIPAIREALPKELSEVRFRVDLTDVVAASIEGLRSRSPTLGRLLPA